MIKNIKEIEKLIDEEYKRGMESHGGNHSRHEGYAVAKEELEEFEDEYDNLILLMPKLWNQIKMDFPASEIKETLKDIKNYNKYMIAEAIQFAAMIEKMVEYEERKGV